MDRAQTTHRCCGLNRSSSSSPFSCYRSVQSQILSISNYRETVSRRTTFSRSAIATSFPSGENAVDVTSLIHRRMKLEQGVEAMKLAGVWQQRSDLQRQHDTFAIDDWQVYRINTFATMVAGKSELDAEAAAEPLKFRTLGELRARIERNWEEKPGSGKVMECK